MTGVPDTRRSRPELVAIVGATGTGKSDLALDLAEALIRLGRSAEIVNADAMQLYRGMDVATAKLPVAERRGIAHHLLDLVEPSEEMSVATFQRLARQQIAALQSRGVTPILVGGSGLYVSSVIQDFDFPARDLAVRARLESDLERLGPGGLHARLQCLDPSAAARVDPANGRRLVRALEVVELQGAFTPGLPEGRPDWQPARIIGLELDRAALVARLDARVRRMWAGGILEETAALLQGPGLSRTAARAIGTAQAIQQLRGELTEEAAVQQTQALTRRYARRQVSWFRRIPGVVWLDAAAVEVPRLALDVVLGED